MPSNYFIRVRHMDGNWYKPGKLETWDGARWNEPAFPTKEAAKAAIAEHYGDVHPTHVSIFRLPVPKGEGSAP